VWKLGIVAMAYQDVRAFGQIEPANTSSRPRPSKTEIFEEPTGFLDVLDTIGQAFNS
jgi:hypothetical protein